MCIVSEELKQLYLDNAPGLVGWYIKRHKDASIYFDTFEDMRQELLLSVWEQLPLYDVTISKFSTYVVVVCKSVVSHKISYANREKRKGSSNLLSLNQELAEDFTLMDIIGRDEDPCDALCRKEKIDNVKKMLSPSAYAYYIDGYEIKEIATYQNKTEGAIRSSIRRDLIKIKREMEKEKCNYEPD